MEVLVGPAFTIDVPPSPPSCGDAEEERAVPSCLYLNESAGCQEKDGSGYRVRGRPEFFTGEDLSETSSSSIGTPDDSDDNDVSSKRDREEEGEEEELQSKLKGGTGLCSLDSLEDSLPIKRGLSSHFAGKSKSFTDLSQVSTVKELQKQENPFNKRRRVLIASKWSRRSSLYRGSNPKSMPLLPVVDGDEDDDDDDDDEGEKAREVLPSSSSSLAEEKKGQRKLQQNRVSESYAPNMRHRLGSFKLRSFSLADLQEHDDEEEDDD